MKVFAIVLSFILFTFSNLQAATCTSLGNGQWDDPLNWSCGLVPSAGDSMIILPGHTVTVSSNFDITGTPSHIVLSGILLFDTPGAKLRLGCGSTITINAGGSIQDSGNGTPSHSIRICGADVWTGSSGTVNGPLVIGINPLPVELISFSAINIGNDYINVFWETSSELNSSHFTLMVTNNGVDWMDVDRIEAAGNSTQLIKYNTSIFDDGVEYIMLRQSDINGQVNFSKAISVDLIDTYSVQVYPNPVRDDHVQVESDMENANISIINSFGAVVFEAANMQNGSVQIEVTNLDSGVYFVIVSNDTSELTQKMIKL